MGVTMRLLKHFCSPAALLAFCCSGAVAADGLYDSSVFAAPEPDVAACSYLTSDCCEPAACDSACDASCGGCNSCSSCCISLFPCCGLGDPWTLQSLLTGDCGGCSNISYGGWVSAGAYANAHGNASNGPIAMRDVGDGFTVNQVWGFFEKATDTGGCGWDWGFRADYVFGVDGPDTQAFNSSPAAWDNTWDNGRDYGSALPQLYAEVAVNDLKVKMGHFYTIMGYEVVPATGNFFTSHAYTMFYAEPFTHTGVLAEYALCDNVTVWGGWVQGWDTAFDNPLGSNDFLGGISVPLTNSATLTYTLDFGRDDLTNDEYFLQSAVADFEVTKRLNYVLQSDWGSVSNNRSAQWYGVNNYLFYAINDCWKLGTRMEWFRDDDGFRNVAGTGVPGEYWGLTCGVNWQPTANVMFRPELRYDWTNGTAQAFDGGTADDQLSGGFDVIVTF
jgi:putative OmpL-like beta-barrel porin-2